MRSTIGRCCATVLSLGILLIAVVASSEAIIITFDTEDDFVTPLVNGQIVDPAFDAVDLEFGNFVNISSNTHGGGASNHLGVTIFDTDPAGPNSGSQDPDLLVDRGNILILQSNNPNSGSGNTHTTVLDPTYGLKYANPNDEADFGDRGSIVFDFVSPFEMISIDMVDINGGAHATLVLTDDANLTRTYDVPSQWTTDVTVSPTGWQTLFLNTLLPQPSEPNASGGDATAVQDAGFDSLRVVRLEVFLDGNPSSAGVDTLAFIPEPSSLILAVLALLGLLSRRRD